MQALKHNVEIQASRHTSDAQLTHIILKRTKFDPTVQMGMRNDQIGSPWNRRVLGFGWIISGNDPDSFHQIDEILLAQKLAKNQEDDLRKTNFWPTSLFKLNLVS